MERQKKTWLKSKGYLHLTNRINIKSDRTKIYKLVTNSTLISKHAFFPLLHKKLPQRRFKIVGVDEKGQQIRGHKKTKNGKVVSTKKMRPIHYATHVDAYIYSYYSSEILEKRYERVLSMNPNISNSVIAYRRIPVPEKESNKNNIHFAKEVFDFIKKEEDCLALAFDIENFFPSLNHHHLKRAWCHILGTKSLPPDHYNVFKSITNFSYLKVEDLRMKNQSFNEKELANNRKKGVQAFYRSPKVFREEINSGKVRIYKNQVQDKNGNLCGIPQGLAISAMLANIYLLEFDKAISKKIIEIGGLYRRYSDDIAIVCDRKEWKNIEVLIQEELKRYKLTISSDKTEICRFQKTFGNQLISIGIKKTNGFEVEKDGIPFPYLGFEFDGSKVLIKSKNISKFYRRMKYTIKTKIKRVRKVEEKYLVDEVPLFKRKLYRTYTGSGSKSRLLAKMISRLEMDDITCEFKFEKKQVNRKYWGNFIGYAYRASKIMNEPAILKQVRNHRKILRSSINKGI